jgi:hypothetical protein
VYRVSAIALFVALFIPLLGGQSTNDSLTGRVTDPSRALVADAKIAATGVRTNVRYETRTNGAGEYYFEDLPPKRLSR